MTRRPSRHAYPSVGRAPPHLLRTFAKPKTHLQALPSPLRETFAKTRHPEPVEGSGVGQAAGFTDPNRSQDLLIALGRLDCGLRCNDQTFAKVSCVGEG